MSAPDTRTRILDTAESLFAERGLAATSVRDIAAAAGLTPASLYNHFQGKEALYDAVLERCLLPLVGALDELSSDTGSSVRGEVLARVMAEFGRRPDVARLIYHEAVTGGAHLVPLTRDWLPPILARALTHMRAEPHPYWGEGEERHMVAMWVQLTVGYFAVAPLMAELLDQDPLAEDALERQTRFLQQLQAQLAGKET